MERELIEAVKAVIACGELAEESCKAGVAIVGPKAAGYKLALGTLGNAIERLKAAVTEGDDAADICVACGQPVGGGCGQRDNGWPFPVCTPKGA